MHRRIINWDVFWKGVGLSAVIVLSVVVWGMALYGTFHLLGVGQ